jgi:hypothetical protein
MRNTRWSLTFVAVLAVSFLSCGQTDEKKTEGGNDQAAASVPGAVREAKFFSVLVPDGWEFMEFNDGTVQTYNKSATRMVELKRGGYNMNEKDLEGTFTTFVTQYKGSPIEKVQMLGLTFLKTTYTYSSKSMTAYSALKDGQKISISLMGPDHQKDATIQAVLASVKLK